jgi:hypothetical protein
VPSPPLFYWMHRRARRFCKEHNQGMTEGKHPDHPHSETGPHAPHEQQKPYWQRAHKDWKFWVGVVLIAAAIVIYVGTLDLSTVPHPRT